MKYLILFLGLISNNLIARDLYLLQPQEVRVEMHQIEKINDPYLYPRDKELKYGGAFITNFRLVEWNKFNIFSNNQLSFEQSQVTGKVISGGWKFSLGTGWDISKNQAIEIGKYHHSYHIFEDTRQVHFPTKDSYYINLVIYKK